MLSDSRFIRRAIEILANSEEGPLLRMYDPTLTEENKKRLRDTFFSFHPQLNKFVVNVGDKKVTTIRIPPLVDAKNCGYFEDRRPPSTIDPYAAAEGIVRASIFGDFLTPGFEQLKNLKFWDSDP